MTIYLVPHTHWDREWYEPFQRFRLRLVDLLDDVVTRAEADPAFRFTLDGQMAAVDDYLEVRPEAADRIATLVHNGQFAVGPWSILLDEFLCSGENIVRNLVAGLARAEAFGGAMPVGYLPDMFGHCAQMPQILAGAGLSRACVWRGVPDAAAKWHAFVWRAPDGTAVRTEYLPGGYGNAAEMIADPAALDTAAADHVARMSPWYGDDPVLAMYGTDHSAPLPWLTTAVAALDGGIPVRLATLAEYLSLFDPAATDGLPEWQGELRSHAHANILPGVLSNRPHLKRALSRAERMVERYAEPLAALWAPAGAWPARLLEMAWQRLIQSSCHDSVTGCGVDETAVQVDARIAEAEQIGRGVRDRALAGLTGRAPTGGAVVVNPSPWARTPVVRLDLVTPADPGPVAVRLPDGTDAATQEITGLRSGPLYVTTRPAGEVANGLRKGSLGLHFLDREVQRVEVSGTRTLTVTMGRSGAGFTAGDKELADGIEQAGGDWEIRVLEEPRRTVYAAVPAPALGWTAVRAVSGAPSVIGPVRVGERHLDSPLLRVEVATDGTLTLESADGTRAAGVGRLVDGSDVGDLYNYAPGSDGVLSDVPDEVTVHMRDGGPLVGSLEIHRRYPWADVTTLVELRTGEPFCRLDIAFENRHPDHRVRLHVPLARPAGHSHAEGQFAVVERGRTSEGGSGEVPLPTFPAYSFVDAGGVAVLLDQVSEYELMDGELAVTLLRATGLISRADHPYRAVPAGPIIATPQAQCLGPVRTSLAVMPHAGDWAAAGVDRAAEAYRCAPVVIEGTGGDVPLAEERGIAVEGATMTSLRRTSERSERQEQRDADRLELRVVALTGEPTTATITGRFAEARRADLLGRPGAPLSTVDGRVELPMTPWEIATIQLG